MLSRLRQFLFALTDRVSFAETVQVRKLLDKDEAKLFFAMSVIDQKHCLRVCRTAVKILDASNICLDKPLLIKAALLHDIGKEPSGTVLWDKVICVLVAGFLPEYARARASEKADRGSLSRLLYVYFNHAAMGAQKLRALGADWRLALLVEQHHGLSDDPALPELAVLRQADELN